MNTVNTALFILVWTFTAVCQADDGTCNVTCAAVTGSVGEEVHLTCSISLQNTDCYIKLYKFKYPKESICKEEFPKELREQRNSIITCSYTPTTAMTERFSFFVQTTCAAKTTEFTVNIAEEGINKNPSKVSAPDTEAGLGSKDSAIAASVGGFILIIIIIIITMTVIRNKKPNFTRACGLQKRMFLCIRHEEDTGDHTEDVI